MILHAEAAASRDQSVSAHWVSLIKSVVDACEGGSRTHIAALGTALLAKATNLQVDVFALKVKGGGEGAYSARSLAKEVLARVSGFVSERIVRSRRGPACGAVFGVIRTATACIH